MTQFTTSYMDQLPTKWTMSLLPNTQNCLLRMHRECRKRFPRHGGLAIPTCIRAPAWRTCPDVCWDRYLAVSFAVGGGENIPVIPGACATRNFTYLVRGPWGKPHVQHCQYVSPTYQNSNIVRNHGVRHCIFWAHYHKTIFSGSTPCSFRYDMIIISSQP